MKHQWDRPPKGSLINQGVHLCGPANITSRDQNNVSCLIINVLRIGLVYLRCHHWGATIICFILIPDSLYGSSLSGEGLTYTLPGSSLISLLRQSHLSLFRSKNTILFWCSLRAKCFYQWCTDLITAWGIGIFRIVQHFLITPVLISKTFWVPWIFPSGSNRMPGNIRPWCFL